MAEIRDDDLQILKGSKALLDKLQSGETRRAFERLVKKHYPDTQTLDDVIEPEKKEILEKIEGMSKEFKEFREEIKGKALDNKLEQDIKYLMDKREFTEEGIERLKKMMIEREIPSIIDAADLWDLRNKPKVQEPSIMAPTDWGFGRKTEDPDLNLLFQDEDAWAEKEARKAWAEETAKKGQILT